MIQRGVHCITKETWAINFNLTDLHVQYSYIIKKRDKKGEIKTVQKRTHIKSLKVYVYLLICGKRIEKEERRKKNLKRVRA